MYGVLNGAILQVKKRKVSKTVKKFLADTPYVKVMELKINLSVEGTPPSPTTARPPKASATAKASCCLRPLLRPLAATAKASRC